jgi:hypothetical protein
VNAIRIAGCMFALGAFCGLLAAAVSLIGGCPCMGRPA